MLCIPKAAPRTHNASTQHAHRQQPATTTPAPSTQQICSHVAAQDAHDVCPDVLVHEQVQRQEGKGQVLAVELDDAKHADLQAGRQAGGRAGTAGRQAGRQGGWAGTAGRRGQARAGRQGRLRGWAACKSLPADDATESDTSPALTYRPTTPPHPPPPHLCLWVLAAPEVEQHEDEGASVEEAQEHGGQQRGGGVGQQVQRLLWSQSQHNTRRDGGGGAMKNRGELTRRVKARWAEVPRTQHP